MKLRLVLPVRARGRPRARRSLQEGSGPRRHRSDHRARADRWAPRTGVPGAGRRRPRRRPSRCRPSCPRCSPRSTARTSRRPTSTCSSRTWSSARARFPPTRATRCCAARSTGCHLHGAVAGSQDPQHHRRPTPRSTTRLKQMQQQFPNEEAFKKALGERNMTIERLRSDTRDNLRHQKMMDAEVATTPGASDAEAKEFYEKNPDKFKQAEQVRASHILIRVDEKADAADQAEGASPDRRAPQARQGGRGLRQAREGELGRRQRRAGRRSRTLRPRARWSRRSTRPPSRSSRARSATS